MVWTATDGHFSWLAYGRHVVGAKTGGPCYWLLLPAALAPRGDITDPPGALGTLRWHRDTTEVRSWRLHHRFRNFTTVTSTLDQATNDLPNLKNHLASKELIYTHKLYFYVI